MLKRVYSIVYDYINTISPRVSEEERYDDDAMCMFSLLVQSKEKHI